MHLPHARVEHLRILQFSWTIELFSPQPVPKLTRRSSRPVDRQTIDWSAGEPLPWEQLAPPPPVQGTPRQWRHTLYLGVYPLDATYEFLHRAFGEDADAYDERPAGNSACAGVLVDQDGRLVADSGVLSSAPLGTTPLFPRALGRTPRMIHCIVAGEWWLALIRVAEVAVVNDTQGRCAMVTPGRSASQHPVAIGRPE